MSTTAHMNSGHSDTAKSERSSAGPDIDGLWLGCVCVCVRGRKEREEREKEGRRRG